MTRKDREGAPVVGGAAWSIRRLPSRNRGMRSPRCRRCRLTPDLCLCPGLGPRPARTRVRLVVHQLELDRASNTGWLVAEMVAGVVVQVHGRDRHGQVPSPPRPLRPRVLVLHPDGRPLRDDDAGDDLELVVPDATWAQARRMIHRVPVLRDAEPVRVAGRGPQAYVRRGTPGQLCTAEAVGRALHLLGDEHAAEGLLEQLATWTQRSLEVRRGLSAGPA